MKCVMCKDYFRRSEYNPTDCCEACIDAADDVEYNLDDVDVQIVLNPTGKTQPVFYDD